MIEKILDALTEKVRKVLASGLSIAVVGWRDSNHSKFTREIPEEKVVFLGSAPPGALGSRIGLVLFTRFMDHKVTERIGRRKTIHPVPIDTGKIKRVLESCDDLLVLPSPGPVVDAVSETAPLAPELDDDVLDFLTTPRERKEMSNIERFIQAFMQEAAQNKDGVVGTRTLGKLRKQCSVGTVFNSSIRV